MQHRVHDEGNRVNKVECDVSCVRSVCDLVWSAYAVNVAMLTNWGKVILHIIKLREQVNFVLVVFYDLNLVTCTCVVEIMGSFYLVEVWKKVT